MFLRYKKRIFILIVGDLICFYWALILALTLRYGVVGLRTSFFNSFYHFTFIFAVWIILFTISRMYELSFLENKREFYFLALKLFLVGSLFATIIFFFLTPKFIPKLVLALVIGFSWLFLFFWRTIVNYLLKERKRKVFIISQAKETEELKEFLEKHPSFGIEILEISEKFDYSKISQRIKEDKEIIKDKKGVYFISDQNLKDLKSFLKEVKVKKHFLNFEDFYEQITGKVPLSFLSEDWFEKYYFQRNYFFYELIKRMLDIVGGIILLILSLIFWPIIGILIKIDSDGEILYKSKRIGKNGKEFFIYKFRTMVKDADKIGPSWTLLNDKRITKVGKFLRYSHLDEIPQVLNILKGDTSFIGPRPEEKRLVEIFKKEIPFYEKRMLIKPGIVGWAQINYPHGASVEDAIQKLKYDFYYLKHRSLSFDFLIALKAWRIPFEIKTH